MLNHQSSILVDFAAAAAAAAGKGKRSEKEGEKERKKNSPKIMNGQKNISLHIFFLKEIYRFETKSQILGQDYLSRVILLFWQQTEISEEV